MRPNDRATWLGSSDVCRETVARDMARLVVAAVHGP